MPHDLQGFSVNRYPTLSEHGEGFAGQLGLCLPQMQGVAENLTVTLLFIWVAKEQQVQGDAGLPTCYVLAVEICQ